MRGAIMSRLLLPTAVLLAALTSPAAASEARRVLSAAEMLDELARSGVVRDVVIEEDINLDVLVAPAQLAHFIHVDFRGMLRGAPLVRLSIQDGLICGLEAGHSEWTQSVVLRGTRIGNARFVGGRLRGEWVCFECRFCRANFVDAQFDQDVTFIGARFGEPTNSLCVPPRPALRDCGAADFSESRFAGAARFDRVDFAVPASFIGAEFVQAARFPRITAAASLDFIGARFLSDAEFRDCLLQDINFGSSHPASEETAEVVGRADFRGCRFQGAIRFDNTVFGGDALFGRAVIAAETASFRGVLGARSLDLRGLALGGRQPRLILDAAAADIVRLDWPVQGAAVLRGAATLPAQQRLPMLEALDRRLAEQGEARAALQVGFEARRQRRSEASSCAGAGLGACLAEQVEWLLWTLPTRNGSDPSWPAAGLLLLWAGIGAASLPRGRLLILPTTDTGLTSSMRNCLTAAARVYA
jgi:uncharacterized protein YjbI with pentapeptide repeats